MEDYLQNVTVAIGDISVLPVERNAVSGVIPVVEAQRASTGRNCELLVE
jgi:hypothetical protein